MTGIPLALVGTIALAQGAQATAPPVERALVPGGRLEQQLSPGDAHSYSTALQAGQFLQLAVVQDGVDVVLTLASPSGQPVEVDVEEGQYGREPGSILATSAGTYGLAVRAKKATSGGRYFIETEPLRAASQADWSRLNAERSLAESAALLRGGAAESRQAALEKLGEGLREWRALGDHYWEAETLLQRATARAAKREYDKVLEDATAALPLTRDLGERRAEARALQLLGRTHHYQYDYDQAIPRFEEAIALRRALGDRKDEADALKRLGWSYSGRGEPRKHVELARQLLALRRELGDRASEAAALNDLGAAHANAGDLQAALESFRETVAIWRALGDRAAEADAMQNVGAMHETLGDHASALAAYEQALPVFLTSKDRVSEASAYHNMGDVYSSLGDSKKALELFNKALPIRREMGDRRGEAHALSKIGAELNTLHEYEKASRHLEEALRIAIEVKDQWAEASVLMSLGAARGETGHADQARAHFQRAAELSRSVGDHSREAQALYRLGRLANEAGDLAEARTQTEAALDVLETIRRSLTSPTLRSTFVASVRETYELYVDVLMGLHRKQPGQGYDARALEASEMARARGLLDLLNEAGLQIREGVDPALLAEERAIQDRLGAALDRQMRLSKGPQTAAETQAAARQVQLLTAEWDELKAALKAKSPRFVALREPVRPTTAEIQKDVLDADTVLLEYALGEKRSFLWVVSPNGLTTHELPPRAVIETAAKEAYAELAEFEPESQTQRTSTQPIGGGSLLRLSRMILGPAADALRAKRLLVVADGALHYVPFAALPHPSANDDPIVATHEVVSAPSASVLPLLRGDVEQRRAPAKTLAVIADPVFDRHDERFRDRQTPAANASAPTSSRGDDLARALRSTGLEGGLPRLPFTRREAQAILSLVPARQRKEALDFDASRATVTDPSLADFRIVHFATHGFLNSAHPELSGIVLSLLDRDGKEARGFLTTTDIFNLHLNAELVVLSGCRTALGREMRGEGLVGLSRGFMYAGSPRVLASLWRVDDAATAELMKRLYRGILNRRQRPGAALRAAQLDLMRRPRFRDPFYWAAFQLQGEWR